MRILVKVLGVILALAVLFAGYLFIQVRNIDVEQLSEDLWVLRGLGGNTAVLKTSAGAVVVDTMTFGIQGSRIMAVAEELTGSAPTLIINTHYHFDHTHGNPAFPQGTRVIATERTKLYLQTLDAEAWQGEAAALMPNETFADSHTLSYGGKTIELIHPGNGHTNGDLVVLFQDERVIHLGDLMFNKHYPNIDLEAGGTVQAWPATLDAVLALDFDRVIPGHGATTDANGLRQFQAFIRQLGDIARTASAEDWDLVKMQSTDLLTEDAGYEPVTFVIPLGLDRNFVLTRAWEEVTGNFNTGQIIN